MPVPFYDGVSCLPIDSHLIRHYSPPAVQPTQTDATGTGVNAQPMTVSDFLMREYPELAALLSQTNRAHAYRVIEAVRPGVVPTAIHKSGAADYLAVLRPRLKKQDKLKALLKAFEFYGHPYDYSFDFITDSELVCSELIYKAYEPADEKEGIAFELVETAGRLMLPPNRIAMKFDDDRSRSGRIGHALWPTAF